MPIFSFLVFAVLNFTQKKQLFFWFMTLLGPFWWVWGNNSSKQCQIELIFWPRGVLIVLQMPFKVFLKSQIFAETWHTPNLSFWSNFDANLPLEDGQNQKQLFGSPDFSKSRSHFLSIFNKNYNFLMCYFGFFRVQIGPGSKINRSQLKLASPFLKRLIKDYNKWQKLWEKLLFGQFCVSTHFPLLTMLKNNEQKLRQAMLWVRNIV